ncbi:hypothetical protein XENOCAPTIV_016732 [Xenoophorus captivus]|uniref:Uncharacterized protein n=1 Tax=Xenoophorus captivus TaxID=1517983 RepID=A0ABV0R3V3_9TELE
MRKYPVSSSGRDKNAVLFSEVSGEWADLLEMIKKTTVAQTNTLQYQVTLYFIGYSFLKHIILKFILKCCGSVAKRKEEKNGCGPWFEYGNKVLFKGSYCFKRSV